MRQLVCFSHTPWRPDPTRTQQLLSRLKEVKILYFEPYRATERKTRRNSGRKVRPNIVVYTMPAPFRLDDRWDSRLLQHSSLQRQLRAINHILQKHRFQEPTLWLDSPIHHLLPEAICHRGLIYDCDREWDNLPLEWESELACQSDVIFAASPGLIQRLSPCCDNIALIPNGVNYAMFSREPSAHPVPRTLLSLNRPIWGRLGNITSSLELEPLLFAASAQPNWLFLLIGRVEKDIKKLFSHFPNILLAGQVPMVDVPEYLSCCNGYFDLLSRQTRGCDILPTRFYEYLALGKPLVLMIEPEQVEPYPDVVYTATDPSTFLRRCQRALDEDPNWVQSRRQAYARKAQWSQRAGEIQSILEAAALF